MFFYKNYHFNFETGVLTFLYENERIEFKEEIIFPLPFKDISEEKKKALNKIFFLAHIAFGISYYKAFLPKKIQILSGKLAFSEATFLKNFYLYGLGEFAFKNNLHLEKKISFPFSLHFKKEVIPLSLSNQILVPVGGGKDSCLTMELLKKAGQQITAFSVGNPKPILDCIQISGIPHLQLTRKISPELIRLNKEGNVYNGHIPITGLISFLTWICAILYDFNQVAFSCERSANSGNMKWGNIKINHQYSKSFSFEKIFRKLIKNTTSGFEYFSFLRPLSELKIAQLFSKNCQHYLEVFTSCNKSFYLEKEKRLNHWCGECDKCRFIFLILAPYIPKEKLIKIVGKNPLNDPLQLKGYQELLGFSGHKPFECVGEIDECLFCLNYLSHCEDWKNDFIIKELSNKMKPKSKEFFTHFIRNHFVPKDLYDICIRRN